MNRSVCGFVWCNLTGPASNGIALLREIDPDLNASSRWLATGSSAAVMFGAPLSYGNYLS